MTHSSQIRALLLLLAALSTLLALTPPQPVQACVLYDISYCTYQNGASCIVPSCPTHPPTCWGTPQGDPTCSYYDSECCF
jgi:hypothetical protein